MTTGGAVFCKSPGGVLDEVSDELAAKAVAHETDPKAIIMLNIFFMM